MHWIDPAYLPETTGTLELFLLNPKGEADGLLLTDGTEVAVPPHLSAAILAGLRPGHRVTVQGLRPRTVPDLVAAVALEPEAGARIVDAGPPGKAATPKPRPQAAGQSHPQDVFGIVRRRLHGPKGEVRGVLLEDGRIGRFPAGAAAPLPPLPERAGRILLRGAVLTTEHGTVIDVRAIGAAPDDLKELAPPPQGKREHRDKPGQPSVDRIGVA